MCVHCLWLLSHYSGRVKYLHHILYGLQILEYLLFGPLQEKKKMCFPLSCPKIGMKSLKNILNTSSVRAGAVTPWLT